MQTTWWLWYVVEEGLRPFHLLKCFTNAIDDDAAFAAANAYTEVYIMLLLFLLCFFDIVDGSHRFWSEIRFRKKNIPKKVNE